MAPLLEAHWSELVTPSHLEGRFPRSSGFPVSGRSREPAPGSGVAERGQCGCARDVASEWCRRPGVSGGTAHAFQVSTVASSREATDHLSTPSLCPDVSFLCAVDSAAQAALSQQNAGRAEWPVGCRLETLRLASEGCTCRVQLSRAAPTRLSHTHSGCIYIMNTVRAIADSL